MSGGDDVLNAARALHHELAELLRDRGMKLHAIAIVRMRDGRFAAMLVDPTVPETIDVLGAIGEGLAAPESADAIGSLGDVARWVCFKEDTAPPILRRAVMPAIGAFLSATGLPSVWAVQHGDEVPLLLSTMPVALAIHALEQVRHVHAVVQPRELVEAVTYSTLVRVPDNAASTDDYDA